MDRISTVDKNNDKWFRGRLFSESRLDTEYEEIYRRFICGDILTHGVLSDVQRALIMLTALTACQTLKPICKYTQAALDVGAKPEEIKETLYHCAPYIGFEKVRCVLSEVNKAFQAEGINNPLKKQSAVTEDNRFEKGLAVQQKIFGKDNINSIRSSAPEELKHIQDYLSAHCFGDFYTRGILDIKMRELITFCAICCMGGCEPQAKAHAGANIDAGNTREMLIDAITQCLPFIGFPRTLNAIACINAASGE